LFLELLLGEFYRIAKDISFLNQDYKVKYLKKIEFVKSGMSNVTHKRISDNIKNNIESDFDSSNLILMDINLTNFIVSKGEMYLIDFDEVSFGEIEFDIADLFLNFAIDKNIFNLDKARSILDSYNGFGFNVRVSRIFDYMILLLFYRIYFVYKKMSQKRDTMFSLVNLLKNLKLYKQKL